MKLHKGTVVYLEKNFKKFEDSAMPEVVVGDLYDSREMENKCRIEFGDICSFGENCIIIL